MLPGVGYQEMAMVLIIAVMLFGSRLPEVLQNLGRSYAKLRQGLTDIQNTFEKPLEEINNDYFDSDSESDDGHYETPFAPEVSAPKFTLPEEESADTAPVDGESEVGDSGSESENSSQAKESEKSE